MSRIWDILMYTILAAMLVLVVLNASNVAQLVSVSGNLWLKETAVLTGTGYKKAS